MKTKILLSLLAGSLLAAVAWLVHEPIPAQADKVPEKYSDTVHKGLEYLVKNQCQDGHWEGDGGKHPVAMTGLVGLAQLMEMDNPRGAGLGRLAKVREAKYAANIRKAADWLMAKSQAGRDGLIFADHPSETARYMEGHGLATLFLAGVCIDEQDVARRKKLTDVLERAVKYLVKAQSSQGGWYHTSKVEGHDFDTIASTAIQIQALQAAENAGIPVPSEVINDAQQYLKTVLGKDGDKAKAVQNGNRQADTAAALACCFRHDSARLNDARSAGAMRDELGKKWLKFCQTEIPVGRDCKFGRDELIHYYYSQAVFTLGGDTWIAYRTAMFDHLQSSQTKEGSWPSADGLSVGPVYATALWCIVLQLDKSSHPSMRRISDIEITTRRLESWPPPRFALNTMGKWEAASTCMRQST